MSWKVNGLTKEQILSILSFDFSTGKIFWKERPRSSFNSIRAMNAFNVVNAGAEAGSVSSGYLQISATFHGKKHRLQVHRIVYAMFHDCAPPMVIDHANQNRSDNRPSNLCPSNKSHNAKNMKLNKDNKTGCYGVWFDKARGNYQVYISSEGKRKSLGRRNNLFDACCLRKSAERKMGFSLNHGKVYSV